MKKRFVVAAVLFGIAVFLLALFCILHRGDIAQWFGRGGMGVPAGMQAPPVAPAPAKPPSPKEGVPGPRIAFVLDDWGRRLNTLPQLEAIRVPMNVSVLPHLPYSNQVAEAAHRSGHIVMLHLPMEPLGRVELEKNTIMDSMSSAQALEIFERDVAAVPYVTCVNNHMGSKVTQNERIMSAILEAVSKKKLFFLDSVTTPQSVVGRVARKLHLPYLRRDVFLDNELNEQSIQARIDEAFKHAELSGRAIAIGHDKPLTLEMIRRNAEKASLKGIRIVPLIEFFEEESAALSRKRRLDA